VARVTRSAKRFAYTARRLEPACPQAATGAEPTNDARWCAPSRRARLTSPAHTRWDRACHPALGLRDPPTRAGTARATRRPAYVTRPHALGQRVPPGARLASPAHTRWDRACHPAPGLRHPPTRAGTARATRRPAYVTRPHALGPRVPPGARLTSPAHTHWDSACHPAPGLRMTSAAAAWGHAGSVRSASSVPLTSHSSLRSSPYCLPPTAPDNARATERSR
jgi:hypothetical protein